MHCLTVLEARCQRSRVMLPPKALEKDLVRATLLASNSSLAYGSISPFSYVILLVCMAVSSSPLLISPHHIGSEAHATPL